MARRIEVELTSERGDNTWTWRAAGARQPKGVLDGSILYQGAKVGDVVRAEAEFDVDGITVISVLPPKEERKGAERIELLPPARELEPVTTTLAPRGRGDARDRRDRPRRDDDRGGRPPRPGARDGERRPRGDRPDRPGGDRPDRGDRPGRPAGERTGRPGGDRPDRGDRRGERPPASDRPDRGAGGERGDRAGRGERRPRPATAERRPRPERPAPEPKPKPKRLRPGRTHRNAVLADLAPEQRPVAEQLLSGGIPAVRQAIDRQNEQLRSEGKPEVKTDALLAMAEELHPRLRAAEWRDRAEAAMAEVEEVDLRDLRSVVVAADDAARDEETRELASQLREALNRRVDREHAEWQGELATTLADGRVVRALRLSSRPPKAGVPLPAEVTTKLAAQASAALTADITQDRWAAVLDAVAYSPVRRTVEPAGVPSEPGDELLAAVRKLADRVPQIATRFGIEPPARPGRPGRPPRRPGAATSPAGGPPRRPPRSLPLPPRPPVPPSAAAGTAARGQPAPDAPAGSPAPADEAVSPAPDHRPIEDGTAPAAASVPAAEVTDERPATDAASAPEPAEASDERPAAGVADAVAASSPEPAEASDERPAADAGTESAASSPEPVEASDERPAADAGAESVASPEPVGASDVRPAADAGTESAASSPEPPEASEERPAADVADAVAASSPESAEASEERPTGGVGGAESPAASVESAPAGVGSDEPDVARDGGDGGWSPYRDDDGPVAGGEGTPAPQSSGGETERAGDHSGNGSVDREASSLDARPGGGEG
jgi:hypothetical protein